MIFRFYNNALSRASRNFAAVIFIIGMLLIGFGFLVWVLRELFAMLFSILFCIVGIGCIGTAIKMFWMQRKMEKLEQDKVPDNYRENVRIHSEKNYDI